jgi:hypothetical protein
MSMPSNSRSSVLKNRNSCIKIGLAFIARRRGILPETVTGKRLLMGEAGPE